MIAILILAGVGVILNFLGRWMVVQEDEGLARPYRWAVMLLPGAELAYVVLRWENAKTGSVVCALSLAFALPLVGHISVVARKTPNTNGVASAQIALKQVIDSEARRQQREQQKAEREQTIESKKEKLTELATYLNQWYCLLEQRRETLGDQPEAEVTVFNRDVAAYHGLLKASKNEILELQRLEDSQQRN